MQPMTEDELLDVIDTFFSPLFGAYGDSMRRAPGRPRFVTVAPVHPVALLEPQSNSEIAY